MEGSGCPRDRVDSDGQSPKLLADGDVQTADDSAGFDFFKCELDWAYDINLETGHLELRIQKTVKGLMRPTSTVSLARSGSRARSLTHGRSGTTTIHPLTACYGCTTTVRPVGSPSKKWRSTSTRRRQPQRGWDSSATGQSLAQRRNGLCALARNIQSHRALLTTRKGSGYLS